MSEFAVTYKCLISGCQWEVVEVARAPFSSAPSLAVQVRIEEHLKSHPQEEWQQLFLPA